jgi:hypothetical protein
MPCGLEGVDWINLAQNKDWLWALVNMIMYLFGSIKSSKFLCWLSILLASHEGIPFPHPLELVIKEKLDSATVMI